MVSAAADLLDALAADVRCGRVAAPSDSSALPRLRLLERLDRLASMRAHEREEVRSVDPADRAQLQVENSVVWQARKCRHYGACLACTLNPCVCHLLPPLDGLSHRLWVVQHAKEVMRTTATGKILLLAHPHATLLVGGVAAHDMELARLCERPSAIVLYPGPDAISPAELLRRKGCHRAHASTSSTTARDVSTSFPGASHEADTLDIIVLDGTWSQSRSLYRTLPAHVTKVCVECERERSTFGTRVRRQGAWREAAGRVSTLEAYAHLALALGDDVASVRRLLSHMHTFIAALPYSRDPVPGCDTTGAEGGAETACATDAPAQSSALPPPLPARTPTNVLRRRARSLKNALQLDGVAPVWSLAGRTLLADFLEASPRLAGVPLAWRVDAGAGIASLGIVRELEQTHHVAADAASAHAGGGSPRCIRAIGDGDGAREANAWSVVASWELSKLLDAKGVGCRSIRRRGQIDTPRD